MTLDEKLRPAQTAEMKPEWQNARLAMVLALNTTMRSFEIKALRWYDVDFLAATVTVRKSKSEAGQRLIPLNQDALGAMRELYRRASAIGGTQPDHYVFPACENEHFDPATPQKSWRSAWRSLRKAAGIGAIRFHDLEHYSHVRLDLKRKALDGLATRNGNSGGQPTGYDTNYDTNTGVGRQRPRPKLQKRLVGERGFEFLHPH